MGVTVLSTEKLKLRRYPSDSYRIPKNRNMIKNKINDSVLL